jgi:hypothetical protein
MAESGIRSFAALRSRNQRRAIELWDQMRAVQTTTSATFSTVTNATKAVVWGGGKAYISLVTATQATGAAATAEYQIIRTDTSAVIAGGSTWTVNLLAGGEVRLHSFLGIVDVPRGAYTLALQWRRSAGGGTIASDATMLLHTALVPVFG